jgi:isopenicillin N synthase-like dioxygenase
MDRANIPVVSLQDFLSDSVSAKNNFIEQVGKGLTDYGFFVLVEHGIDQDLLNASYQQTRELFALSEENKKKYEDAMIFRQRGYTSFGKEHAKDSKLPDLKEFWHVGREFDKEHPLLNTYPKNFWPMQELPRFRPVMLDFFSRLDHCAMKLLEACALYLGETGDLFTKIAKDGDSILRLIHYPPVEKASDYAAKGAIRAAAHEDINLITLLVEATASGLELKNRQGEWLAVKANPGEIIVDSGDMIQNITNGLYKATTHRVVNPDDSSTNGTGERYSMPFFMHPRKEASLNPLQSCITKVGEKKFPDINAGDYLSQRLAEIGLKAD